MRRGRLGLLGAAMLSTGCSDTLLTIVAPELPPDATRAAVIVIGANGRTLESTGLVPPDTLHRLQLRSVESDIGRVVIVAYRDGNLERVPLPEEAELARAPVELNADTAAPLPPPDWAGLGFAGTDPIQVETTVEPVTLTAAWAPNCARSACERYPYEVEPERIELSDFAQRSYVVEWDFERRSALVITDGATYRVFPERAADRAVEINLPFTSSAATELDAVAVLSDGRHALMDLRSEGSRLWLGRLDDRLDLIGTPLLRPVGGPTQTTLTTSPPGESAEIYAVSRDGPVLAWEGDDWDEWAMLDPPKPSDPTAVWLAPNRLFASLEAKDAIYLFDDGQLVRQAELAQPGAAAVLPALGGVLVLTYGAAIGVQLWRVDVETFEIEEIEAEDLPGNENMWVLSDTQALFTDANGTFTIFEPGLGNCLLPRFEQDKVTSVVQLQSGLLTITTREQTETTPNFVNFYPRRNDDALPACVLTAP